MPESPTYSPSASPLSMHELALHLQNCWGIAEAHIEPLHLGRARNTWVFRAQSHRATYFLKLKKAVREQEILVSGFLANCGAPVSTPIPSVKGGAWECIGHLYLQIFPYLDALPMTMLDPTACNWVGAGAALRAVHHCDLPSSTRRLLETETFLPQGQDLIAEICRIARQRDSHGDVFQQHFIQLWERWGSLPAEFFFFTREKGQAALETAPVSGLCHGDFQGGNILQATDGAVTIIDWDEPVWAPPERDLIFVPASHRADFASGYGGYTPNDAVMQFECANWLLKEVLDCADRILFTDSTGDEEKQWALELAASMLQRMNDGLG